MTDQEAKSPAAQRRARLQLKRLRWEFRLSQEAMGRRLRYGGGDAIFRLEHGMVRIPPRLVRRLAKLHSAATSGRE